MAYKWKEKKLKYMINKEDFFQLSHLKSCFDGLNRAGAVTRHALEEEQPGLLVEDGVGGPARVTRHVLLDVTPQHILNVFLLESSLDDQLIVSINSSTCSQLWLEQQDLLWTI